MNCPECAAENRAEALFCDSCGAGLGTDGAPEVVGDRYELGRFLGEGGMKQVFAATDTRLGREVALAFFKTDGLSSDELARIEREIKAMVALGDHPRIVSVSDFGEDTGRRYVVTRLMSGGDLAARLAADDAPVDMATAMSVGNQIADALAHAHSKGVIHRDVKPENIWFDENGGVHLGDFGLAVAVEGRRVTQDGAILGTPAYLAPESASGGGLASDEKSDLYSLGVVLYELTTGRRPFEGSMTEIVSQHINVPPVAPKSLNPEVPTALESLILALLSKSPERRPESAAAVAQALAAMAGAAPVSGTRPEVGEVSSSMDAVIAVQSASSKIVGRGEELETLRAAIDEAAAGRPGIVTVSGEPGIGKTRLVEEAVTYAELRGFSTATGRCLEDEGAPAFWPWVGALRELLSFRSGDEIGEALGNAARVIARILPEVSTIVPGVEADAPPREPEQARFQLFDGIAGFLRRISEARPIVIVLEDLHWADTPSLRLLQFIAQAMSRERILIIGTFRDVELGRHHPLADTLGDLTRSRHSRRIGLGGLTVDQIGQLIESITGSPAPAELATAVDRQTEGNPFFVGEVVRLLEERGTAFESDPKSWSQTIPQGVREVVGQRLSRLSDPCNEVLLVASVIGREFSLALLDKARGDDGTDALEAVIEAEEAKLVAGSTRGPGSYLFEHALVRETLYQELSTARRAMLHRKVGVAIEELYASNLPPHYSELAHHFLRSAGSDDLRKAIDYLQDAGQRSIDMLAYEDAVALYESALEAVHLAGAVGTEIHCDVLLGLGDAQWRSREGLKAKAIFREAWDLARDLGDGRRFATAVLRYPGHTGGVGLINEDIDDVILEALAALDPGELILRARLLALRAWALAVSENVPRSPTAYDELVASLLDEAEDLARQSGDPMTLVGVLSSSRGALGAPHRVDARLRAASEIIANSENAGDADALVQGLLFRVADLIELGRIDEIDTDIAQIDGLIAAGRGQHLRWLLWTIEATLALLRGDFDEAERLGARNMTITNQGDEHEMLKLVIVAVHSLTLFTEKKRLRDIEPIYAAAAKAFDTSPTMRGSLTALAFIYSDIGKIDEAAAIVDQFAADEFEMAHTQNWMSNMAYLAMAIRALGDQESARKIYEMIEPFAHLAVIISAAIACLGSVSRYLGMLAGTFGDYDLARRHYEYGIAANERIGARPYAAHCRHELAEILLSTGEDRAEADALLETAIAEYTAMGMTEYASDAQDLLEPAPS